MGAGGTLGAWHAPARVWSPSRRPSTRPAPATSGSSAAARSPTALIQTASNSPVNHVGMAVVLDDLPPLMWHAELGRSMRDHWTGDHHRGVQLHDLREAVTTWQDRYGQRAWLRQVSARTSAASRRTPLLRTVARLDGVSFPSHLAAGLAVAARARRLPHPARGRAQGAAAGGRVLRRGRRASRSRRWASCATTCRRTGTTPAASGAGTPCRCSRGLGLRGRGGGRPGVALTAHPRQRRRRDTRRRARPWRRARPTPSDHAAMARPSHSEVGVDEVGTGPAGEPGARDEGQRGQDHEPDGDAGGAGDRRRRGHATGPASSVSTRWANVSKTSGTGREVRRRMGESIRFVPGRAARSASSATR